MIRTKTPNFAQQDPCLDALLGLYSLSRAARREIEQIAKRAHPAAEKAAPKRSKKEPTAGLHENAQSVVPELLLGVYALGVQLEELIAGAALSSPETLPTPPTAPKLPRRLLR